MSSIYAKLYLAEAIGKLIGKSLAKMSIRREEYAPRYKIEKDSITIYNFSCVDEHGYTDTSDFIELSPTKEPYDHLCLVFQSRDPLFLLLGCLLR